MPYDTIIAHCALTHLLEGNCISDIDCVDNLICQVRSRDEEVTGCDGQGGTGINYCRYPTLINLGNNPESSYPLGPCEGNCENDDQCQASLLSYQGICHFAYS